MWRRQATRIPEGHKLLSLWACVHDRMWLHDEFVEWASELKLDGRTAMRLISAILLSLVLCPVPQVAIAAPPPPIRPGSPMALRTCRYTDSFELRHHNSGNNGILYSGDDPNLPSELAPFGHETFTFRVCADIDNTAHYFVRIPGSSQLPPCEIFEQEVFRDPSGKVGLFKVYGTTDLNNGVLRVSGWTEQVPEAWQQRGYPATFEPVVLAQTKDGPCLLGNDPSFAHITNVPPGLFNAMMRAFREAAASDQGFSKNFSGQTKGRFDTSSALHGARILSVTCTNTNCIADLSNEDYVVFDVGDKGVAITGVLPPVD